LQGKELQVAERQKWGRYSKEFRQAALERLKSCDNITALATELGVQRRLLYKWLDLLEPDAAGACSPSAREVELQQQVTALKRLLADKTLEVDFFKSALHKIAAPRQSADSSGETASSKRFEN
jgi:transposase-like protein